MHFSPVLSSFLTVLSTNVFSNQILVVNLFILFCFVCVGLFIVFYTWEAKKRYIRSMDNPTTRELQTLPPYKVAMHSMVMSRTTSRMWGFLMKQNIPRIARKPFYSYISKNLGINEDEFAGQYEDYPNPNSFFTRSLKSNARPVVRHEDIIVSPCDSTVSYMDSNPITTPNLKAHQVKGVRYLLSEFLGQPIPIQQPSHNMYTITLYLSPSDYHRVHSPTFFSIQQRVHFPGKLLPVKNYYAENVKGLFTINERVILNGMVGAFNVGSISLANPQDSDLRTNRIQRPHRHSKQYCYRKKYRPQVEVLPGDPVGTFHLGSTVVLAFEAEEFQWLVEPGEKVKMGQPIGVIRHSQEVDKLIQPNHECEIDPIFAEEDESLDVLSPVISSDEEAENIEIETKGNYVVEVVKDLYHAGMRIYRMRSLRHSVVCYNKQVY